ncbi:ATP-binding protein [Methylonatrum kenyense]|uniref:sensor histidine kinase n=1 Tax=Methylonatrum kenyense TaxID=455253 RepID=UPI0020BE7F6B|nr:ATP-binding protein [Methylonatrum kenyense]MCK8517138.1 ATP-binding protein [Methylonatrum kenyense]
MKHWPLVARLLLASWLLVLLILPLAGIALSLAFQSAVNQAFDERLKAMLHVTSSAIRADADGRLDLSRSLGDARFEQVFSGWYWQVSDPEGPLLSSRSLWDEDLPPLAGGVSGEVMAGDAMGPREQPVRQVQRRLRLPDYPQPLQVVVAGPTTEVQAEVAGFRRLLLISLASLGVLLLLLIAVQLRWGLAPLRRMRADLHEVQTGQRAALDTRLPADLRGLAETMNRVLDRDRRLIERGRNAAGNLAHAIKTPLAVMRTQLAQLPEREQGRFERELKRVDEAVRHHLARASAAGSAGFSGQIMVTTALAPVLDGLGKMAERRGVTLDAKIDERLRVSVDPHDLQELAGNLLENAVRWANTQVRLTVDAGDGRLWMLVEDDGPGMSEAQRRAAMDRGKLVDSERSRSGLGMAIVRELVDLYAGDMQLGVSAEGGLSVRIEVRVGTA